MSKLKKASFLAPADPDIWVQCSSASSCDSNTCRHRMAHQPRPAGGASTPCSEIFTCGRHKRPVACIPVSEQEAAPLKQAANLLGLLQHNAKGDHPHSPALTQFLEEAFKRHLADPINFVCYTNNTERRGVSAQNMDPIGSTGEA